MTLLDASSFSAPGDAAASASMSPAGSAAPPTLQERALELLSQQPGWERLRAVMVACPDLEAALCGGTVRDLLLDRRQPPRDLDVLLNGASVQPALATLHATGALLTTPFGSPRWYPNHDLGFYWDLIPIHEFANGLWPCEDVTDALNQFDFTANAVAVDLRTGAFHDPQNGCRDAARRTLRAVRLDYPDEPIAPGAELTRLEVLWFRLLHYAAELDFTLEPVTLAWLRKRDHRRREATFAATFFPLHPRYLEPLAR